MSNAAEYTNPAFDTANLDRYVIRSAVLAALECVLPEFRGRFLDVGAGNQPYREMIESSPAVTEYFPLDLRDNERYRKAEYEWDGVQMPFDDATFDSAMATEVLEHCPEPSVTLSEVSRVLRPGGSFFFTVPFVWPLHDCPHDEYRYTPWSIERHLKHAGFERIQLWPTGGWDATLAQVMGLWVRRRPMKAWQRELLSRFVKPLMRQLIRRDKPVSSFDNKQYLMPGIAGTAHAAPR